jgi:hypothetical protein
MLSPSLITKLFLEVRMISSPFFDTNNPNKEIKDAHLFGLQDNWYSQYPSVTTNCNYQLNFKGKDGINNAPISIVFSEIRDALKLLRLQNKDIYAKKLRTAALFLIWKIKDDRKEFINIKN